VNSPSMLRDPILTCRMSSRVVNFATDIAGLPAKVHATSSIKALNKFCANVAKEYPVVKRQWCIAAGHYLAKQGKKVTATAVLKAARRFSGDIDLPKNLPKMVNSLSGGSLSGRRGN